MTTMRVAPYPGHTMPTSQPRQSTERDLRRLKPILKFMNQANILLFRSTGGVLGSWLPGGARIGLLTTTGRKTGQRRTAALLYLRDGERIVLVASQGGMPRHPIWFLNLEADPKVEFQTGSTPQPYRARRANATERASYWPQICELYSGYETYQRRTDREIPLVILEPAGSP